MTTEARPRISAKDESLMELLRRADEAGVRLEIVEDLPVWEPLPSKRHQSYQDQILVSIEPIDQAAALGGGCGCWAFSDTWVRFPDGSLKRPDISVFCQDPPEEDDAVTTVPEAVIEIISPGYERKDTDIGVPFYVRQGVKDVILVYPRTGEVVLTRGGEQARLAAPTVIDLTCGCQVAIPRYTRVPLWQFRKS